MIIILKKDANADSIKKLEDNLKAKGIRTNHIEGINQNIIGLIGDTSTVDMDNLYAQDCVESVKRVQEPYKNANRKFHPDDTVIKAGNVKIGDGSLQVVAGPCSVESEEQIITTAIACKQAGATMLRGGAFKPRTSPYSFQGLRGEGIKLLIKAREESGLPIVTEIMSQSDLDLFADVDVIQVGARNMQNFELLKELGGSGKPVMLKRGYSATLTDLLMSAEYIMSCGNSRIILCERGIRTFETASRNTLDISAVPLLKEMTHLPVFIDPSHATGKRSLVTPMSLAAAAAGADGIMVEVHTNPQEALCDGPQALTPADFKNLMKSLENILPYRYRY